LSEVVKHTDRTWVAQQSVTKLIIADEEYWSHCWNYLSMTEVQQTCLNIKVGLE